MKLNINLKMDAKWLTLFILILIIIALYFLNYGHPIIQINQYANCTCQEKYIPYWITYDTNKIPDDAEIKNTTIQIKESKCCYPIECYENIEDIPKDCNCIYPVACGTLEELEPCACCGDICQGLDCDWDNRYQINSSNCKQNANK